MGTWDVGPFDNDAAADFCGVLDETAFSEREAVVRTALLRAIDTRDYLDHDLGAEAVAAASLIAAQCPSGTSVSSAYGPKQPLPRFATTLRQVAVSALDRVVTPPSELVGLWGESAVGEKWQQALAQIREVLAAEE